MSKRRVQSEGAEAAVAETVVADLSADQQAAADRRREVAEKAQAEGLPPGSVERAMKAGGRDPSVDVDYNPGPDPSMAHVTDEESAIEEAKRTGRPVAIPGHPEHHFARADGSVGPYQAP